MNIRKFVTKNIAYIEWALVAAFIVSSFPFYNAALNDLNNKWSNSLVWLICTIALYSLFGAYLSFILPKASSSNTFMVIFLALAFCFSELAHAGNDFLGYTKDNSADMLTMGLSIFTGGWLFFRKLKTKLKWLNDCAMSLGFGFFVAPAIVALIDYFSSF